VRAGGERLGQELIETPRLAPATDLEAQRRYQGVVTRSWT
jgi:hypothetical protein